MASSLMLNNPAGLQCIWERSPIDNHAYDLRDGLRVYATMLQPSSRSQERVAMMASGQWTLAIPAPRRNIVIRYQTGAEVAWVERPYWSTSAMLHWSDGSQYMWRPDGWLTGRWSWLDLYGRPAVTTARQGVFSLRFLVGFAQGAALTVDPILLAALGYDLLQIMSHEAAQRFG